MAFQHGKSTAFKLDNSSGTLTDLSTYVNNVDFPQSVDTHETTAFGASAKAYIVGLKDSTISISGNWDPTLDAHLAALLGLSSSSSFEFSPAGTSSGNIKYTGEAWVTSYQVSDPVGDLVTWSADLQVTGAVTRGTHA